VAHARRRSIQSYSTVVSQVERFLHFVDRKKCVLVAGMSLASRESSAERAERGSYSLREGIPPKEQTHSKPHTGDEETIDCRGCRVKSGLGLPSSIFTTTKTAHTVNSGLGHPASESQMWLILQRCVVAHAATTSRKRCVVADAAGYFAGLLSKKKTYTCYEGHDGDFKKTFSFFFFFATTIDWD